MDCLPPQSEHLCYVRCSFCNTVLAVGVPCRRSLDTVTVKCGYCNCLSFLSTKPRLHQVLPQHHHHNLQTSSFQGFCNEYRKGQAAGSSSLMGTSHQSAVTSPNAPFVVKPPERKHRLPSAYNRFMKEEIQRIKVSNPEIPHREAFSTAAKNWARYIPHSASTSTNSVQTHSTGRSNGSGVVETVAERGHHALNS